MSLIAADENVYKFYLSNKILIFFSELDSFDKDHEISQFFHFQVSDLFKDTMNMLLIKL